MKMIAVLVCCLAALTGCLGNTSVVPADGMTSDDDSDDDDTSDDDVDDDDTDDTDDDVDDDDADDDDADDDSDDDDSDDDDNDGKTPCNADDECPGFCSNPNEDGVGFCEPCTRNSHCTPDVCDIPRGVCESPSAPEPEPEPEPESEPEPTPDDGGGCDSDTDCEELQVCDVGNNCCKDVECKHNGHCSGGEVCNLGTNKCGPCGSDNQCGTGNSCSNGVCIATPPPAICDIGEDQLCPHQCPDGSFATQACQSSSQGNRWGVCECPYSQPPPVETPSNQSMVEFVYTRPASAPEPDSVRVVGWVPGFSTTFGDLCNSSNSDVDVFHRSGNTYSCTRLLPTATWADGDYNVADQVGDESIDLMPSRTVVQYHCYERMGDDLPSGCSAGAPCAYATHGHFSVGGLDMNQCRLSNGLVDGGCNVSPMQCGL